MFLYNHAEKMSNTSSDILRPETAAWCLNHTYPPNKKNKKVGITLPCQVSTPMSTEKYIPLKNQFFSNEQNELPKRRNEADVASQIRLQLRSESFTQEKTEAPCFPTEEITKRSTSRGRSLGKSIPLECSENSMFFDLP